jgi:hypothetical protein
LFILAAHRKISAAGSLGSLFALITEHGFGRNFRFLVSPPANAPAAFDANNLPETPEPGLDAGQER